jgi:hypothetical protein
LQIGPLVLRICRLVLLSKFCPDHHSITRVSSLLGLRHRCQPIKGLNHCRTIHFTPTHPKIITNTFQFLSLHQNRSNPESSRTAWRFNESSNPNRFSYTSKQQIHHQILQFFLPNSTSRNHYIHQNHFNFTKKLAKSRANPKKFPESSIEQHRSGFRASSQRFFEESSSSNCEDCNSSANPVDSHDHSQREGEEEESKVFSRISFEPPLNPGIFKESSRLHY